MLRPSSAAQDPSAATCQSCHEAGLRLAAGDLHDRQSHDPQLMVFAGPLVGLLGVFFFVCGVLQFCGVDVDRLLGMKKKKKSAAS